MRFKARIDRLEKLIHYQTKRNAHDFLDVLSTDEIMRRLQGFMRCYEEKRPDDALCQPLYEQIARAFANSQEITKA